VLEIAFVKTFDQMKVLEKQSSAVNIYSDRWNRQRNRHGNGRKKRPMFKYKCTHKVFDAEEIKRKIVLWCQWPKVKASNGNRQKVMLDLRLNLNL
jgi:hypothetical protein